MKKFFAMALAVVMMFAVCVPAFAATQTANAGANPVDVHTTTDNITEDGFYTVTIPADMPIAWGTASTEFEYSVTCQMKVGKLVNVKVAADSESMKSATNVELPYSLAGTLDHTTTSTVVADEKATFTVEVADFNVEINEYRDTVTFTVAVVDA